MEERIGIEEVKNTGEEQMEENRETDTELKTGLEEEEEAKMDGEADTNSFAALEEFLDERIVRAVKEMGFENSLFIKW